MKGGFLAIGTKTGRPRPWWSLPPHTIERLIEDWPQCQSDGFRWGAGAATAENRQGWQLGGDGWLWDQDYSDWLDRHLREWQLTFDVPERERLPYCKTFLADQQEGP